MITQSHLLLNLTAISFSIIILIIRLKPEKHPILWYLSVFPSVLIHELSHYTVALILKGKPVLPSFEIQEEENGYVMGSVICKNPNALNSFPVGIAPLFLLILAYLITFKTSLPSGIKLLCLVYLVPASIPSKQDLKVAFSTDSVIFWSLVLITAVILYPHFIPLLHKVLHEKFFRTFTLSINRFLHP